MKYILSQTKSRLSRTLLRGWASGYILLAAVFLFSGCYLGKELLDQYAVGSMENLGNNTPPPPLNRGDFMWSEFIGSVISLAAGTYLVTRKIRLLLLNFLNNNHGQDS